MTAGSSSLTLERYSAEARAWVASAQELADERGHVEVQPLHLLARALDPEFGIVAVFRRAGLEPREIEGAVESALRRLPTGEAQAFLSSSFLGLLRRAEREAERVGTRRVRVDDLLGALTHAVRGDTADILASFKLGPGGLKAYMDALRPAMPVGEPVIAESSSNEEWTRDWLAEVRSGRAEPVVGRLEEMRRVLTVLERRAKCHPILIGEPGIGKGALVRAVAQRMVEGDVAARLLGLSLVELDLGALSASSHGRAEAEARLRRILERTPRAADPDTLFFVRITGDWLGAGPLSPNFAELLRSGLAAGRVRLLTTATPEQFRRLQVVAPRLAEHLTPIPIQPPSAEATLDILRAAAVALERHHRVRVTEPALRAAVMLAQRYLSDRFLPESALDLLDEAAASRRVIVDGLTEGFEFDRTELGTLLGHRALLVESTHPDELDGLRVIDQRLEQLRPRVEEQRRQLEARRNVLAEVRRLEVELAQARAAQQAAKQRKDFAKLGELEHVAIPALLGRLQEAEREAQLAGADPRPVDLGEEHVAAVAAEWTGIPLTRMLEVETEKLRQMPSRLSARVIGQEAAVDAISRAIRRSRVGLRDPKKPIGSFLFLGTSGVGKTELAKALAEFLFDDEQALIRLDMSEFMERHMAQRLLGAPPGYADSEQGGFLTEAVRRKPYSVLLFDEVEKAHQDVFNLLLQILDDGRLTDGRGQTADFSHTVVILTSNIGADAIWESGAEALGDATRHQALEEVLRERLRGFFRPEFLNRIGDTVIFSPLGKPQLHRIAELQARRVAALLEPRGWRLEVEPPALDQLVELGFEPALGARPLQRAVTRYLQDPLAERIVDAPPPAGTLVRVGYADAFTFSFEEPPTASPGA